MKISVALSKMDCDDKFKVMHAIGWAEGYNPLDFWSFPRGYSRTIDL